MDAPDDPLSPRGPDFAEPWQAQTLAMAHALIRERRISAGQWAAALGAALSAAARRGAPDTDEQYYLAALEALESVVPFDPGDLAARKRDWTAAYRRTPHGQPVLLKPENGGFSKS